MFTELALLIGLLLLSGFFSSSELAFILSNKIKIEVKSRNDKNIAAKSVIYFTENPQQFFSIILIGNNIVNISFASISTLLLSIYFGFDEWTILALTTISLLIFGEIIPKYFARELSDFFILLFIIPIRVLSYMLYPAVKFTSALSNIITQSANASEENMMMLFDKEDIESLVEESHKAGVVEKREKDIISKVFEFKDQRVYEVMRPRTEIVGVEIDSSINDVINIFIESGYSKLPVYEENLDNIKGVVIAYDMFRSPDNLHSVMREIIFVPETKKSFEMMNEFLTKQVSIAIVIDEFGGTAGLVTMEDVIEELFGEIKDEFDVEEDICKKIDDVTYLINGKVEIDHINEKFELNFPLGDYETIAGFITSHIGRIPKQGESIVIDDYNFLIARADNIRIELLKLVVNKD